MARLSPRGIKKRFKAVAVLHGIDLDIDDKEFVVFDGPSGCGRSTLLRLIAGLDPITEGEFSLNGRRMNGVPPSRRGTAVVFQSTRALPHMDGYENMAFGARLMGLEKPEIEARIREAACCIWRHCCSASRMYFPSTSRFRTSMRRCAPGCGSRSPSRTRRSAQR